MQKIVLALAAASASAFVGPAATRLATKINTATIEPETPEEEVVAEVAAPPAPRAWAIEQDMRAGITGPFGFFDPLSLSAGKSEQRLKYFREAELKHARVAMLAAVGFPLQEQFHPLFGGDIDAPSYISFQMTPLQTFWPIVVSAIFLLEANTALQTFKDPTEALWALKEDHAAGDLGFDPLNFGAKADLRAQELAVGRLAMLGIAGMVAQEVSTQAWLFTWFETI